MARAAASENVRRFVYLSSIKVNGEQSMLTFMLYLNGGFEGGATSFQGGLSIKPEAGMILVFRHALYHEGAAVVSGRKYVLRSDVMFSL